MRRKLASLHSCVMGTRGAGVNGGAGHPGHVGEQIRLDVMGDPVSLLSPDARAGDLKFR